MKKIILFLIIIMLLFSCSLITREQKVNKKRKIFEKKLTLTPGYYYYTLKYKINQKVGLFPLNYDIRLWQNFEDKGKLVIKTINFDKKSASINPNFKHSLDSLMELIDKYVKNNEKYLPLKNIDLPIPDAPDLYIGNPFLSNIKLSLDYLAPVIYDENQDIITLCSKEPSYLWKNELRTKLTNKSILYSAYFTLGLSKYYVEKDSVKLSENYSLPVSTLNKYVDVLQIKGVLLDEYGRTLNYAAEGIAVFVDVLDTSIYEDKETEKEKINSVIFAKNEKGEFIWQLAIDRMLDKIIIDD